MSAEPGSEAIPAATVVLLRDGTERARDARAAAELEARVRRHVGLPGRPGRPRRPARRRLDGDPLAVLEAARNAAVREAAEEAGLTVERDALAVYAHWSPPRIAPKRFTTWFFVAPAPVGDVVVDGGEIHEHEWVRPADGIRRRDAGEIELAPPTWVTLTTSSRFTTVADAMTTIDAREPELFETRIATVDDAIVAMWLGDAGYESGDADAAGARHRLRMADDGWSYERDH